MLSLNWNFLLVIPDCCRKTRITIHRFATKIIIIRTIYGNNNKERTCGCGGRVQLCGLQQIGSVFRRRFRASSHHCLSITEHRDDTQDDIIHSADTCSGCGHPHRCSRVCDDSRFRLCSTGKSRAITAEVLRCLRVPAVRTTLVGKRQSVMIYYIGI